MSDFYKISNFIQAATANFFYINQNLDAQFKFLSELAAEYDTYKNIFPYIASALIQRVAREGTFKRQCVEIFYDKLGDPRFGNSKHEWDKVKQVGLLMKT